MFELLLLMNLST